MDLNTFINQDFRYKNQTKSTYYVLLTLTLCLTEWKNSVIIVLGLATITIIRTSYIRVIQMKLKKLLERDILLSYL